MKLTFYILYFCILKEIWTSKKYRNAFCLLKHMNFLWYETVLSQKMCLALQKKSIGKLSGWKKKDVEISEKFHTFKSIDIY